MKPRIIASTALLATFLLAAGSLAISHRPLAALADPATGSITGQIVWNAPVPMPYGAAVPDGAGQSGTGEAMPGQIAPFPDQSAPDASPDTSPNVAPDMAPGTPDMAPGAPGAFPAPGVQIRPVPIQPRLIPAGAVLVAIQGTNLSARTDDQGRFRIDNVPAGLYLTVAAGPVRGVTTAVALRPNVYIQDGGGTVDLGRLYLGQSYYPYYGPVPYGAAPDATAPDATPSQP